MICNSILYDLTGGSTKVWGIIPVIRKCIEKGLNPTKIIAVSVTSMISVLVAFAAHDKNYLDVLDQAIKETSLDKIFKKCKSPVTKKGKFSLYSIWQLIKTILPFFKDPLSLGIQDLDYFLEKYIGEHRFELYKDDPKFAEILVAAIEYKSKKIKYFNLKELTWIEAKEAIKASCAMPFWTQPIIIDGLMYFDAGVTDQNAGGEYLKRNKKEYYDVVVSISLIEHPDLEEKDPNTVLDILDWMIRTRGIENREGDLTDLEKECKERGMYLVDLKVEYKTNNFYEVNRESLQELYTRSLKKAEKELENF